MECVYSFVPFSRLEFEKDCTAVSIIHSKPLLLPLPIIVPPFLQPVLDHLSPPIVSASHLSHVSWVVFIFLCFRHQRPSQHVRSLLAVSTPSRHFFFISICNRFLVLFFHLSMLVFHYICINGLGTLHT